MAVKLTWGPEEDAFRAELVAFLDANVPTEIAQGRDWIGEETGTIPQWARDWQALLFDSGWMIPAYPPELGGRNATPLQTLVYQEELSSRGVPRSVHFGGYAIVGPSLLEFGNEDQRALAPAAIRGDTVWCVGMSEPDAGSDLAALSTRAEVDGDSFVVTGQKVWTSYAMAAQSCFLLRPHRPDRGQAQGHLGPHRGHGHPGDRGPAAPPPLRRGRVRRGVPRRGRRAPGQPGGRAEQRLAHHHGLARPRARRPLGRGGGRVPAGPRRAGPHRP